MGQVFDVVMKGKTQGTEEFVFGCLDDRVFWLRQKNMVGVSGYSRFLRVLWNGFQGFVILKTTATLFGLFHEQLFV